MQTSSNILIHLSISFFDVDEINCPCINKNQVFRNNHPTDSVEQYYRVSCFLSCLDTLKEQLKTRFEMNSKILTSFQILMPAHASIEKIEQIQNLKDYYISTCSESRIQAEYRLWCENVKELKSQKLEVLKVLEQCDPKLLPNINMLLRAYQCPSLLAV